MTIVQKFLDLLGKNADKVDGAVDKAGDMIDKKTGGKYQGQVDAVQRKAKDAARSAADKRPKNP